MDYINDAYSEKLSTLLQFIAAVKQLLALGLDKNNTDNTDEKIIEAIVCFHTILLPTVDSSKNAFFKYMNKALDIKSSRLSSPS